MVLNLMKLMKQITKSYTKSMKESDKKIYDILKKQGGRSGVVQITNDLLRLLSDIPKRTISRSLERLEEQGLIQRQTHYKRYKGKPVGIRMIVINPTEEIKGGFTIQQHKVLSRTSGHNVKSYPNQDGTVTYEWWRLINGEWERNMEGKVYDWTSFKEVWNDIYDCMSIHYHIANTGDYSLKKLKRIGLGKCSCSVCTKAARK